VALGTFDVHSILPGAAGYFAIGILSRLILPWIEGRQVSPLLLAVGAALAVVWFAEWRLPLVIWGVFYAYLVYGSHARVTGSAFRLVFNNRASQLIGRISYSIYLSHYLVMVAVGLAVLEFAPGISRGGMHAALLAALALTIPISILLFGLVEQPGNRLGARIASRLSRPKDASPPRLEAGRMQRAALAEAAGDLQRRGEPR